MPHHDRRLARLAAATAAAVPISLILANAHATNVTWSSPASGQWLDPSNWTPAVVPSAADSATIDSSGSYTITVDGPATSGPLTLNAPGATLSITNDPAASLTLSNTDLYFNAGAVAGAVSLDNSTVHFAPGLTNAGAGTFTYFTTAPTSAVPFAGNIPAGATLVHRHDSASTNRMFDLPSFTNAGTIRTAILPGGMVPLYRLDNASGTFSNTGSLGGSYNNIDRGFGMVLEGNLVNTGNLKAYSLTVRQGNFDQNAGALAIDLLCTVQQGNFNFNGGTLSNGSLCTVYQGTFNYNGGTLTGNPVGLFSSTLNIAPGTNPASFTFYAGTSTIQGTPAPNSTISLDSISYSNTTVTVTAENFTNVGTLRLASTLAVCNSTLTVAGSLTNAGSLSVTKGLGGTRTLNANVINTGTFSVGPGTTLTLAGSLTTSTPLDLQGTLNLKTGGPLVWSYAGPSPADTVRILLATAHLTSSSADATHRLGYVDTGSAVTVSLTLTGDANCDGKLDADDFALLDKGFARRASSWWLGDFNYDGQVTSADYLLLDTAYLQKQGGAPSSAFLSQRESQFGPDYVSALLASVPEPSSALAAILVVIPAITRRRRSGL